MEVTSYTDEFKSTVQKEAIETLLQYNRGTANIAMRLGKTLIGLKLASQFDKVLVCYPNKSILNSWLSDAKKFEIDITHVTFTTFASLRKNNPRHYDVVIIDEIHDLSVNQWTHLTDMLPNKLYGLSGTPPIRGEKAQFLGLYCPIRYTKRLKDTTGITNKDYEIFVHLVPPSKDRNIPLKSGKFWSEANQIDYFDRLYEEKRSMNLMITLISKIKYSRTKFEFAKRLLRKRERCIIFLESIDQCNSTGLHSYHSAEPKSEDNLILFQEEKINQLATVDQLRQGITFSNLSSCILTHSYASNSKASQKIGRCLNYVEGEKATIDIVCLKGTRDEDWVKKSLAEFDNTKIKYISY